MATTSTDTPATAPTAATDTPQVQDENIDPAQIVSTYKAMRDQISELANKITELDSDRNEHSLVLRALTDVDGNRRCYRSIGGVLVERTVNEVRPAVEKNLKNIEEIIKKLSDELREREKVTDDFRVKFNIQMGDPSMEKEAAQNVPAKDNNTREKKRNDGVLA